MRTFYNDNDPGACAWLRELQRDVLIADGTVDERPIEQIRPDDLVGYARVHLFAGIAGWDYALQLSGWPDDEEIWTCSCPCPPFSCAGKKASCPSCQGRNLVPCPRRTGYFICADCRHAWLADARHLWPEVWRLISQRRPARIVGEQVASADGLVWLAGVRASLEICGYRFGAADYPAAGVGSPNIRQRLFWMADAEHSEPWRGVSPIEGSAGSGRDRPAIDGAACGLAESNLPVVGQLESSGQLPVSQSDCGAGGVGIASDKGLQERVGNGCVQSKAVDSSARQATERRSDAGFWHDSRWHYCRDGKYRRMPLEPALFPLAARLLGRVGLLRGAGNAINVYAAARFIKAYIEQGLTP
jgi:DNA (cytosine-5)-methyltransferase 1